MKRKQKRFLCGMTAAGLLFLLAGCGEMADFPGGLRHGGLQRTDAYRGKLAVLRNRRGLRRRSV